MANQLTEEEAEGMTGNERLSAAGLLNDLDRAVERRDFSALRSILEKVYLSPAAIEANIERLLGRVDETVKRE
jgi:hypothetical protein